MIRYFSASIFFVVMAFPAFSMGEQPAVWKTNYPAGVVDITRDKGSEKVPFDQAAPYTVLDVYISGKLNGAQYPEGNAIKVKTKDGAVGWVPVRSLQDGDAIFEKSLKKVRKWSASIWRTIKENNVQKGMTEDQVILSWGVPDDMNTNSNRYLEQWVYQRGEYKAQYLYFTNGRLESWQNF